MDAITLLRDDHKAVEQLFKRFEKTGPRAHVERRQIVDRIIEELSVHAAIEEQIFYPTARAEVPATEAITLESLEEHHIVKWVLAELAELEPTDERFEAKVTVLIENVRHHIKEEENDFFPLVRAGLSRSALADLGTSMATAKKSAPTHPHPRSPDTPQANNIAGTVVGILDRVGDNVSGVAQGGVTAAQDLIARIRHTNKPKTSPTGSSVARNRADAIRRSAAAATHGAQQTAHSIGVGATKTARAAKAGAKGTLTIATKSARDTKTTAKRATTTTTRTAQAARTETATVAKRAASKTAAAASGSR